MHMTLGLLTPSSSLNIDSCNQQSQTSASLSHAKQSSNLCSDIAMSNVPQTTEEDTNNKDSFDPSVIRSVPSSLGTPQDQSNRQPLPFPPQQLHLPPQSSLTQQQQSQQQTTPSQSTTPLQHQHTTPQQESQSTQLQQPSQQQHPSQAPSQQQQSSSHVGVSMPYGASATAAPVVAAGSSNATALESRPRDHLQTYDLFPDMPVVAPPPTQQDPVGHSSSFHADIRTSQPQSQQPPIIYNPRHPNETPYSTIPLPASSSRIVKRHNRAGGSSGGIDTGHEQSSSPSVQSPTQRQSTAQTSLERRKAHRAYTQKSRNKVNSRFEALLDALPTPPPRLNPRSKAEILEYATETVIRLVSQNNKLELSLALSSTPHLEAWLTDQTQHARTVREVCQPIMRLFTIGLEWKGAEAWAIDSRAPMNQAALGQAWTFVPPPTGRQSFRDDDTSRMSELSTFLDSARGSYFETCSSEALAVVYRTGKPAWLSCEYKTFLGFEENEFNTERTRMAMTYGISDVLFVPLILYNHVQIVVNFYNMRSRSPSGNPALQPQTDPKSAIKVATEAIDIIARRFCSLPGVSEFADK